MATKQKGTPTTSYRVVSITDGYFPCENALGTGWCGHVHADYLQALLCENKRRHGEALRDPNQKNLRHVFRGQLLEHADGRRELQAIQRSDTKLGWEREQPLEKQIPGFKTGACRPGPGDDYGNLVMHSADDYARNVALLKAEIARLTPDGLLASYTLHYDARGHAFISLAQLEKANAKLAAASTRAARVKPARTRAARRSSSAVARAAA
jgi:hypothetical protein